MPDNPLPGWDGRGIFLQLPGQAPYLDTTTRSSPYEMSEVDVWGAPGETTGGAFAKQKFLPGQEEQGPPPSQQASALSGPLPLLALAASAFLLLRRSR